MLPEAKYWFPNICDGKAIVAVEVEAKYMFDSFSTICQPHVQTLGQQHLRGVKAVTELQFYAHRVDALILTKSYDCLVFYRKLFVT